MITKILAFAALVVPLGLDLYMPVPATNPLTMKKVEQGRRLFFDKRLSGDGSISCATCHQPERAFSDSRPVAVGIGGQSGRRNAPAIINRGYGIAFFWDGRETSLEALVVKPIEDAKEMGTTVAEAAARVRLAPRTLVNALATFVRSIRSGNSRFDRFAHGERTAMSASEQMGLAVFRGKGNCSVCHSGPTFTDERFHNTGVAAPAFADTGRFEVTGLAGDRGAFKTPTLRDVEHSGPYMHDGSIPTLEAVVEFYDQGGRANLQLDLEIRPLRLTSEEKAALLAFLRTLTGRISGS